jgi:flagellar motor switch protein FliG
MNEVDPYTAPAQGGAPARPALSRRQKAAIVVRYLLNEGAALSLADLSEDLQADLTREMAAMRQIDRATLAQVVTEFAGELEQVGLSFPRGIAAALNDLDGRISPDAAARLRRSAGMRDSDPWARLRGMDADTVLPLIAAESTEVAAVTLSKLDVGRAAELLARMPGAQARRITCAMPRTGAVTPEAVCRIGRSLLAQIDDVPPRAFDAAPETRLGEILNMSPSATREDLLSGLDDADAAFARRVRAAIFTFANIPGRLAARDVPKLARAMDQGRLVSALRFATTSGDDSAAAAEFILSALPSRMAETMREEMEEAGTVRPATGEEAMNMVAGAIRDLAAEGEITLGAAAPDADGATGTDG